MNRLTVEHLTDAAQLPALEPEWAALAAAHGEGLPFRTFEWAETWCRWFPERRFAIRDSLCFRLFRDPGGRLVGVAPLILVRRPGCGPALVRGLEFLGADPYVTEIRGVLADPAWEAEVYRALLADLEAHAGEWDWIRWRGVPAGSAAAAALGSAGAPLVVPTPSYVVPLAGDWETFKSSRPRNLKESLRKCYNSLKRDGHAFELGVARTEHEVRTALERFLELHRLRAEAEVSTRHPNVFADPACRAFLFDVCQRLAARDAVRIFQLRIRGEVVATRIAFALGDTLYVYFSGYDPAWQKYSVMTTTVAEAVKYAFASGFKRLHLSTGTDESKLRWRPDCTTYLSGEQPGTGRRAAGLRWLTGTACAPGIDPVRRAMRAVLGRKRAAG
ncbi:MAG: GNAT family N-acetyltransferase [Anaeromyxobacter sp.]